MIFQVHIVFGDDKTYITFNILQLFLKTLLHFIILLVKLFEKYHKLGVRSGWVLIAALLWIVGCPGVIYFAFLTLKFFSCQNKKKIMIAPSLLILYNNTSKVSKQYLTNDWHSANIYSLSSINIVSNLVLSFQFTLKGNEEFSGHRSDVSRSIFLIRMLGILLCFFPTTSLLQSLPPGSHLHLLKLQHHLLRRAFPPFFQLEHYLYQLPLTLDRVCYPCSWYLLQYLSHSIVIDFTMVSFHLSPRSRDIPLHTQTFILLSGELLKVWHRCKEKHPCGPIRKYSANPWCPGQHEFLDDE